MPMIPTNKLSFFLITMCFPIWAKAQLSTCDVKTSDIIRLNSEERHSNLNEAVGGNRRELKKELEEKASNVMMNIHRCIRNGNTLDSSVADFALTHVTQEYEEKIRMIHFELRMAEQAFTMDQIDVYTLQRTRQYAIAQFSEEESMLTNHRKQIEALRAR